MVLLRLEGLTAAIGVSVMAILAMPGIAAAGLAFLAAPFVLSTKPDWPEEERSDAEASA